MHEAIFYLMMATISSMTVLRGMVVDETLVLLCYLLGFLVLTTLILLMGKQTVVSKFTKEERVELIRAGGYLVVNDARKISFSGISRDGIKTITVDKGDHNNRLMLFYDAGEYVIIRRIYEKRCPKLLGLKGFTYQSIRCEYELHLSSMHDIFNSYGCGYNYDCAV